jgi:hypothetical protein
VSLEDLYNGKTAKLAVSRDKLVGKPEQCRDCNGKGVTVRLRQIGPGMVQQIQQQCPTCSASGFSVKKQKERQVRGCAFVAVVCCVCVLCDTNPAILKLLLLLPVTLSSPDHHHHCLFSFQWHFNFIATAINNHHHHPFHRCWRLTLSAG